MQNPSAVGFTGGFRRMWGDFVGDSMLTDEGFKRLASDLASGLISLDQVRAAGLEDEIRRYLDAEDMAKHKKRRVKKITVEELKQKTKKETEPENPCAGCKFRKYHDWAEPTWTGFSQHYYDCEKPGCPMWSRLWWRNNDDGTVLMDQQPIRLTRKFQHAVYEIIRFLNEVVELLLN